MVCEDTRTPGHIAQGPVPASDSVRDGATKSLSHAARRGTGLGKQTTPAQHLPAPPPPQLHPLPEPGQIDQPGHRALSHHPRHYPTPPGHGPSREAQLDDHLELVRFRPIGVQHPRTQTRLRTRPSDPANQPKIEEPGWWNSTCAPGPSVGIIIHQLRVLASVSCAFDYARNIRNIAESGPAT